MALVAAVACALLVGPEIVGMGTAVGATPWNGEVRILIGRADDVSTPDVAVALADLDVSSVEPLPGLEVTAVTLAASDVGQVVAEMGADARFVEPDTIYHATTFATPTDPWYSLQPELAQVHLPTAWGTSTGNVTVAVIDSGVTPNEDLSDGSGSSVLPVTTSPTTTAIRPRCPVVPATGRW